MLMIGNQVRRRRILSPELKKVVIEQLAKEIQITADTITNLRTKTAFTIWIGPYVLLGSIVVAQKDGFTVPFRSPIFLAAVLVVLFCYMAVGHMAGVIEQHNLERANKLRQCIVAVAETSSIERGLYLHEDLPKLIVGAYRITFLILLACFVGAAVLINTIESKGIAAYPAQSVGGSRPRAALQLEDRVGGWTQSRT
jgi:hypothetical protein